MDENDDNGGEDERDHVPRVSRMERSGERRYRVLSRTTARDRKRDRFRRLRQQVPISELIGRLIEHHGVTDAVRQQCVCIYWPEIVGERIASKTEPVSFVDSVLHVSAPNSSWVHELRFLKTELIARINNWVDTNKLWLGPPPLVLDMRFALAIKRRNPLVDREHLRRLRHDHVRRLRPRTVVTPPIASDLEREAIRAETGVIADREVRTWVESFRLKWNL